MPSEIEHTASVSAGMRSTGIVGLDFQLGGGIPVGKSLIVFGSPLSGCELFAEQFWLADKSKKSTYLMIDSTPKEGMTGSSVMNPDDMAAEIKGEWVVVDSLSTIILKYGIEAAVSFIDHGIKSITEKNGNVLFVLYSGIHTPEEVMKVIRRSDIFITLSGSFHGNEIERNLTVNKISGQDVPKRAYPYDIMSWGIELSTTGRVI
ncbi:KaiC/GvpD/RAD55 family RecA-like ATPase [Methanomicrobium sp. W14]|uniref:RAD55 family ATPase n=1 Tax=Methanomicrobium sp. W14 TaxID=2817839 RepID=UPI001AEB4655|nr:ATPase domain-containing protein [Methanomicrobium sp. W14]MBP2132904.1 KaiC/GvpD/RAD55 family RecA-like ATPase [Methanomicrobium sp. W14]